MRQPEFEMERWQSRYENAVGCNLSESGVLPFTFAEFCELANVDPGDVAFGYGSTDGSPLLRERVAALYPGAAPADVLITAGSAEANFLVLWRLVEPGDRVVVVQPTYGQTPGLARGLGADVVSLDLREDLGWQPEPGAAAAAITPETRLVVVTNPNNPTGAVLSDDARREIVSAAAAAGAWLLADEVYAGAELGAADGGVTASFHGAAERVIVTASLSKAYGLQGLRLGWAVAPPALREALWARKDYTSIAPAVLSDRLAAAALEPDVRRRILRRCRAIIRDNFGLVEEWAGATPAVRHRAPDAGAIALFAYEGRLPSRELAERLRTRRDVLVVPGAHFGVEGTFRIGFGYEAEKLPRGLAAVAEEIELARETGASAGVS